MALNTFQIPSRPFFYIRHGKTEANAKSIMCGGEWDIPLIEDGIAQAHLAGTKLINVSPKIDQIFVSPMIRARQTADIINEYVDVELQTVENLREWKVGEWEKKPWGDLPNPFTTNAEPPGGESRFQFEQRIASAIQNVLINFAGVPLFVSHGAAAHALFTVLITDLLIIENCQPYFIQPAGPSWKLTEV